MVDRFKHGAVFNDGGYFLTDCHALVCRSFLVSLSYHLQCYIQFGLGVVQNIERFLNIGVSLLFPYLSMFANDFQWRLVSCRNQYIDLRSKLMDWFL